METYGLESLGIINPSAVYRNLTPAKLVEKALALKMPAFTCLNVNFPAVPQFQGVKVCRMARSRWQKEVERRRHPWGPEYFWLVGESVELEPEATDTDRWALAHGYVAITPTQLDVTAYGLMQPLQDLL